MNTWTTYVIITILLLLGELLYFKVADRFNIIDKPNERSSHTQIVLRGGGIIFTIGMWLYAAFFGLEYWPFILGLTLVAGISFLDDIHSLPDSVRLVIQFIAMALVLYQFRTDSFDLRSMGWYWQVLIGLVALIVMVGATNIYNFMDGINGINGGYTLAVLLPLLWLNHKLEFIDQRLLIVAILADLVFCHFNFRPKGKAKCFAGDVGSIGAAFIVIFALGKLILKTYDFTYLLFLAIYGADACLTIIHRIMLHENLGEAHRKHAYQIMANELSMEHTVVSTLYTLIQLCISVGLILIPNTVVWHWGYFFAVCFALCVAYLLFMLKYYHLHDDYLNSLEL